MGCCYSVFLVVSGKKKEDLPSLDYDIPEIKLMNKVFTGSENNDKYSFGSYYKGNHLTRQIALDLVAEMIECGDL